MPAPLPSRIIDTILLGQGDRRRQLQDFPILADVWTLFAQRPGRVHDLLITPHRTIAASRVAEYLDRDRNDVDEDRHDRAVAHLQGLVAVRLSLTELWTVILPASSWWAKVTRDRLLAHDNLQHLDLDIAVLLEAEIEREGAVYGEPMNSDLRRRDTIREGSSSASRQIVRLGLLIGCLAAAAKLEGTEPANTLRDLRDRAADMIPALGGEGIRACSHWDVLDRLRDGLSEPERRSGIVWNVAANRQAEYAASRSVPAIKADAARQLFSISCADIGWAVVDSGIDRDHPAFLVDPARGPSAGSRIVETYDFSDIRAILSRSNLHNARIRHELLRRLTPKLGALEDIEDRILALAASMSHGRPVDWSIAEPLIRRLAPEVPANPHGTHVAGILGGHWTAEGAGDTLIGVCPDIRLYDLRVLGPDAEQTEFAVIAALQFVRFLNSRNSFPTIDGVNLSLSIPHNVRNYACGRTPVCMETEALAAAGTVVVAAAGNRGYQSFRLSDDTNFDSYAASSITDPGNADAVITVGATHRYWPHTYGVSFFSSRGPTGDGRLKPDILAPGERIESSVPGPAMDSMDGTSMAAPHVSGAAALLMARHRELKGRPARIKEVLCSSATDLGRERSFQGHGMLDVLRALQSL